jgi:hypothetical protein
MFSQSKPAAPLPPPRNTARPDSDLRVLPRDLGSLFAQRPLIQGESEDEYDDLLSRVTSAVAPADVIEAVWVKDIVDLIWESQRLRRLKASLFMAARKRAVMRLLETHQATPGPLPYDFREWCSEMVTKWLEGDKAGDNEVKGLLEENGLDLESVMAQALSDQLGQVERIDRMIASADARRHKVLVEIERRRDAVARRLRTTCEDVIDVP